ncbi:MAG: methionyl-tRNA formyltransferase, partial [Chitinophagaceae bacterium]
PVLQPEKLKNPEFIEALRSLKADLQIVVAFRMLPEVVWNMPPMGSVNLHGSLLPQYRGAAPINWAVINGEKETGVTSFKLKHEIDTGDILLQQAFAISGEDNAGDVHDRMKAIGAEVLLQTVKGLAAGSIHEIPQPTNAHIKHAPKISPETGSIDFNKSIADTYNLVRGLAPAPAAHTLLEGKKLKVYKAEKLYQDPKGLPGSHETDGKTFLQFAASDGYIKIIDLQLEGKKRMLVEDFLRGYRFQ